MEKISILAPSCRPKGIMELANSIIDTANHLDMVELVIKIDIEDKASIENIENFKSLPLSTLAVVSPSTFPNLSKMWNMCADKATGDIFGMGADDLEIVAKGWDDMVREAFNKFPDKILFVYGPDGKWNEKLGTHGFVHRTWVNVLGYFTPPQLVTYGNDDWLHALGELCGRKYYIPEMVFKHAKGKFTDGKSIELAELHKSEIKRRFYNSFEDDRRRDAHKLQEYIAKFKNKWET